MCMAWRVANKTKKQTPCGSDATLQPTLPVIVLRLTVLLAALSGIPPKSESAGWRGDQPRPPVGRDKSEKPQGIADLLPDWVGYGFLYGLSGLPVIIGVLVVAVLFFNSLK